MVQLINPLLFGKCATIPLAFFHQRNPLLSKFSFSNLTANGLFLVNNLEKGIKVKAKAFSRSAFDCLLLPFLLAIGCQSILIIFLIVFYQFTFFWIAYFLQNSKCDTI